MNIHLTALDFELLRNNDLKWNPEFLDQLEFISRNTVGAKRADMGYRWQRMYWFGDNYASVILAKSFLSALGQDYELYYDTAEGFEGYVILTDYERE